MSAGSSGHVDVEEHERLFDGIVVAALGLAVAAEGGELAGGVLWGGDEVPGVGVAGHVAGGELLAAAADPDGDIAVDGLGLADRVVDLVVAALERRALLRPEGAHDLDGLAHAMHPLGGLGEVEAVHGVLGLVPSRPDAHV